MRRILILFLSFYTTSVISQNVNYSQILIDMLMRDECFGYGNSTDLHKSGSFIL